MLMTTFLAAISIVSTASLVHAAPDMGNASSIVCSGSIGKIEISRQDSASWNYARNTRTEVGPPPKMLVHMDLNSTAGANFPGMNISFIAIPNMGSAIDYIDGLGGRHHKQAVMEIESVAALDGERSIILEFGTETHNLSFYMSTAENHIENCVVR